MADDRGFQNPLQSSSVEFEITGYYDPGRLQVAKTPTYPVMCRFPVYVALCNHNPPMLQTDGRMDGRHARSISATC